MKIDGRTIAEAVLARTKMRAELLARKPRVVAIMGTPTPATLSYLRIKERRAGDAGCAFETHALGDTFEADAVIVQLPLPREADERAVCDSIPIGKDADVLSAAARDAFEQGAPDALLPPVVGAIQEIFDIHNVVAKGKKAVVVGNGFLVGAPAAVWLMRQGADVTVLTADSADTASLRDADIVICGAGSPHLISPEMLKAGAVLIDAGTSESGGAIVGDANPACEAVCSVFTPVPGGVGPIAVAKLFENVVTLAERATKS